MIFFPDQGFSSGRHWSCGSPRANYIFILGSWFFNRWCPVSRILKGFISSERDFCLKGLPVQDGVRRHRPAGRCPGRAPAQQPYSREAPSIRSGPVPGDCGARPAGASTEAPVAGVCQSHGTSTPHPTSHQFRTQLRFSGFCRTLQKKGKRGILLDLCFGPSQVALSGSAIQLYNVPSLWRIVKLDGIWRCSPTVVLHRPRSPQIFPTASLTSPLTPWRPGFGFSPIVILYYFLHLQLMFFNAHVKVYISRFGAVCVCYIGLFIRHEHSVAIHTI